MDTQPWLKDVVVFLVAAGVAAPVFRALGQSAVFAFLVTGIALGPFGLGRFAGELPFLEFVTIGDPHAVEPFAELGVLFLLFLIGLELSFERLWALRRYVFGLGGLQVIASAALIAGAAALLGLPPAAALVAGLALSLSSTAIVMQLLTESRQAASATGRTAFSVLLFQDLMVAPILMTVAFLGVGEGTRIFAALGEALVAGLLAVGLIFLVGRFIARRAFRLAASAGGRDMMLALTFLAIIGAAGLTGWAGLSLALGAFLSGLLLGETEYGPQIEIDLEPFKGLLLGLFFMTVGMSLDPVGLLPNLPLIAGLAAGLIVLKGGIVFAAARGFGLPSGRAVQVAGLIGPGGEFAFVVVGAAIAASVLAPGIGGMITAIAGLSMLATPLLARLGSHAARKLAPADHEVDGPEQRPGGRQGHVIIAGYGRVGRTIGELLASENADVLALDIDPERVSACQDRGVEIFYGDASRSETLAKADAAQAALVIITLDDAAKAEKLAKALKQSAPGARFIARARDRDHADRLLAAGADFVIHETVEVGLQLAGRALQEFGLSPDAARARLAQVREASYAEPDLESD
ncbi:cation:proton antiporter domain-containing protein [Hyphobacterium marinum]|uniref:Cation:proton antiporter n=1 Tax=Hyphobacterium marinum TaxID=3116574 RepID=A0ABU7LZA2_9PROT|nr:cation:proton antiporter [Hyphobacterium sp. Y6023]MEE2566888.1 cation:proton antiporter [Hyphobacterium sp. Y6023]